MKIIALSVTKEGLENLLTEEKLGDIEVQQNHLVESPDLKPRFHLTAVEYLKEKGVFKGAASTQVDCLLKSLRDQKEKVDKASLGMLARLPWGRRDMLGSIDGKYEGVSVKYASLIVYCHWIKIFITA